MAQGINLINQVGALTRDVGTAATQLGKQRQSSLAALRDQRKSDFALLKQILEAGEPIVTQTARETPEKVESVIEELRRPHQAALKRIGIDENIRIFSRRPRDLTVESQVILNEQNIAGHKEKIKESLGFVPSSVEVGNVIDVASDKQGNVSFKFRNLAAVDNKALQKKILELRGKGAKSISQEEAKKFPEAALRRFPSPKGEEVLLRPPREISGEVVFKLAAAREGRLGAKAILQGIEKGDIGFGTLKAVRFGIAPLSTKQQKIRQRLDLTIEGLGRALSGAQVKEDEVKRFKSLFGLDKRDTFETMIFKLERVVSLIDDAESLIIHGASPRDDTLALAEIAEKELAQFTGPQQNVQEVQNIQEAQELSTTLPPGSIIRYRDEQGRLVEVTVTPEGQ